MPVLVQQLLRGMLLTAAGELSMHLQAFFAYTENDVLSDVFHACLIVHAPEYFRMPETSM